MNGPRTTFNKSVTNILIFDLLPYHVYSITVIAVTLEQGPESHPISFRTLEDGEIWKHPIVIVLIGEFTV